MEANFGQESIANVQPPNTYNKTNNDATIRENRHFEACGFILFPIQTYVVPCWFSASFWLRCSSQGYRLTRHPAKPSRTSLLLVQIPLSVTHASSERILSM